MTSAKRLRIFAAAFVFCLGGLIFIWSVASLSAEGKWQLTNITGHLPDLRFSLTADNGQKVTAETYRNDVVLLYFGFSGCSTQCPLTMTRLSRIIQQLGNDANHARVLFVTVTPETDTPQMLHSYLASFDAEHMAGLTGSGREIERLAKRCRAAYRADYAARGDIPHSNVVYIFDAEGHARLLATLEDSDEKIINDIRRLAYD